MPDRVDCVPMTALAELNPTSALPSNTECSFIGMEDVSEDGEWVTKRTRSSRDAAGYTPFRDGDVLFAKITPCMENGKGVSLDGLIAGYGFGSTEFHVLRARPGTASGYIAQWTRAPALRLKAEAFMTGSAGQRRVPSEFFSRFEIPAFPLAEQRRIAQILDTVDEAVRSTERLIAKLEQVNRGLVHDLLARGIDNNGLHRDPGQSPELFNGTPLGRVPRDWSVVTLCDLYRERPRNGLYKPSEHHGHGSPMVQMGQLFQSGPLDVAIAPRVAVTAVERETFGLQDGDLLFGRRSLTFDGAGRCALVRTVPEPTTFESSIIRVRLDPRQVNSEFAHLALSSAEAATHRRRFIRQVAVSGVTSGDVGEFLMPVPPMAEQHRIVDRVRAATQAIDFNQVAVTKLHLVKAGLMDDLLTGRVRIKVDDEDAA